APTGNVGDAEDWPEVVGQVGEQRLKLIRLEEALSRIVLLEHVDIRNRMHTSGTMREPERAFERGHVSIRCGVRVAGTPLRRLVRGNLVRRDVDRSQTCKRVSQPAQHGIEVLDVAAILLVVVAQQLAEIVERRSLLLAADESAAGDLADALLEL